MSPTRSVDFPRQLDALREVTAPLAYVDLDAFDGNGRLMAQAGGGLPIRVASKSIRCRALIARALGTAPEFQGVLAYTPAEALHLLREGVTTDVLVAYPSVDHAALTELARWEAEHEGSRARVTLDGLGTLEIARDAAQHAGHTLRACVDIDTTLRPLGERGPALGARRSPLRTPGEVSSFIRLAHELPGVRVDALMAYDAQVAGLADRPAGRPVRARGIALVKRRSLMELRQRVPKIVAAAREEIESDGGTLELVNVGGTGSLAQIHDLDGATELAAGSGFFKPTLFDGYDALTRLQPAAFFVLPVVREPGPGVVTLLGGGYAASGTPGADRSPTPVWPPELSFDANEGAGEVQSPLTGPGTSQLATGDRVVLRHTKAGELCERFNSLQLLSAGQVVDDVATYRGDGHAFL